MAERLQPVLSRIDALKRQLYDALTNPRDYASMLGGRIQESGQAAKQLQGQAFADPRQPFKVTDEAALRQLTDMMMAGPLGFAPVGMISPQIAQKVIPQTKVVDESGKPMVVYHGSDTPNIDWSKGATRGDSGLAYFSDADVANSYAIYGGAQSGGLPASDVLYELKYKPQKTRENSVVYPSYLDIKNPAPTNYDLNNAFEDFGVKKIVSIMEDYQPQAVKRMFDDFDDYKQDGGELNYDDWVKQNANEYFDLNKFGAGDETFALQNYPGLRFLMHTDLWKKSPYDGLIYKDAETGRITYTVKDAKQIKSAVSDSEMSGLLAP